MNSRQRFKETIHYGNPDRLPLFEEGIREATMDVWREQGYSPEDEISKLARADRRDEIQPEVDPIPEIWPSTWDELDEMRRRLDPHDPVRLPKDWNAKVLSWSNRDHVVMLRMHRGFFQSMGVFGWERFNQVILMLIDEPEFVRAYMKIQGEFTARLADHILQDVTVDAAVLSEPIGANHGPLISPRMYEDFVLSSYEPLLEVLQGHGIDTFIFRTYANARVLIPSARRWGFNCLWGCEVDMETMNYHDIRREHGKDLRFIGGIDLDLLREDKATIKREIEKVVPQMVCDGGYIPLADGRVRADVPFENYLYYRELLGEYIK